MRTARMIGIKEDGSEAILHPRSASIETQLTEFNSFAVNGVPKGFVEVVFQTSDGRERSLRNGITAALKDAEARVEDKEKNRDKWLKKQAEARVAAEKAEAEERQKRIDAANAEKEAAKKKLLAAAGATTTTTTPTRKDK